jgi:hypothetical protein
MSLLKTMSLKVTEAVILRIVKMIALRKRKLLWKFRGAVILRIVKVIDSSAEEASTEGKDSRTEGEEDLAHGEDTRNLLLKKDGWIAAVIKVVIVIAIFQWLVNHLPI